MADGGRATERDARALPHGRLAPDVLEWRIERAFSDSVRQWSERPAVEVGDQILSYRELEARAESLAARLAGRGVGGGDIVALACRDAAEFAVGALGVLKTGAAYLSLDLRYPLRRAPAEVFASAAVLVVGDARDLDGVPADLPILEGAFDLLDGGPDAALASRPCATGRDPAYLCYTSGTTGVAKAALIPHAGVSGLIAHPDFEALAPGARMASCSTFAFDAITFEVWGALLNGACVVQVPLEVVRSPPSLADFLSRQRIDGAFLTTSLFNAVSTQRPEAFGAMTMLVIGGEAVQAAYVRRVFESGRPPRRLLNGYGPTETTTFATCHAITAADADSGVIPIGRPIAGREAYVLKADGAEAAVGEEGELWIGGDAVALGYRNAPDLTAEKFATGLVPERAGVRFYRTGDLCEALEDGVLLYLGRADEQVKVKGYRIEPAGVAALLRQIEGVSDAAVVARDAAFGAKQIVAFLIGDRALSEAELQAAAARLMPDYMLPAAYAWVDAFPLKANGKLDAAALLAQLDAQGGADPQAQPSGELERALVEIWKRNGGRATFDLDTPLEDVCDSLAILGVMLDVATAFGRPLPAPNEGAPVTIRSMGSALRAAEPVRHSPVRAFYVGQPWNMAPTPAALTQALGIPESCLELRVPPVASSEAAYHSIEAMAEILEERLLEAGDGGPYTIVGHSFGGVLAFELARRLEQHGERIERLLLLDSRLARRRGPLGRAMVRLRQFTIYARKDPRRAWERIVRRTRWAFEKTMPSRADLIREWALEAMLRYAPKRLGAPTVLINCTQYVDIFERPENSVYGAGASWRSVIGSLKVATFDCGHNELVQDPRWASKVADYLR